MEVKFRTENNSQPKWIPRALSSDPETQSRVSACPLAKEHFFRRLLTAAAQPEGWKVHLRLVREKHHRDRCCRCFGARTSFASWPRRQHSERRTHKGKCQWLFPHAPCLPALVFLMGKSDYEGELHSVELTIVLSREGGFGKACGFERLHAHRASSNFQFVASSSYCSLLLFNPYLFLLAFSFS